jgi:hypothetical protein
MSRSVTLFAATLLALGMVGGCGGEDRVKPPSGLPRSVASYVKCLDRVGAKFADSEDDLDFYFADLAADEANRYGSGIDNGIAFEWWEPSVTAGEGTADEAIPWTLVVAQPIRQRPLTVQQLLQQRPRHSFVAYMEKPGFIEWQEFVDCGKSDQT